jgi:hypothetical protein
MFVILWSWLTQKRSNKYHYYILLLQYDLLYPFWVIFHHLSSLSTVGVACHKGHAGHAAALSKVQGRLCWHSGRNMRIDELSVPSHMSLLYYINNWYKCCCSCHHFWIYYEFDLLSFYTILHHSTSLLHLAILSWVGQCCNPITSQVGSNDFRRP